MSNLKRVVKLARILRIVTVIVMIAIPTFMLLAALVFTQVLPENFNSGFPVPPNVVKDQVMLLLAIGLVSPVILLWTLNEMRKLFGAYAMGEVLTDQCAQLILRIGKGFLTLAIATFLLRPVQIFLTSLANPSGERVIAIGINNEMIFFSLSGGMIIVIGWAMREASNVASENRSFV